MKPKDGGLHLGMGANTECLWRVRRSFQRGGLHRAGLFSPCPDTDIWVNSYDLPEENAVRCFWKRGPQRGRRLAKVDLDEPESARRQRVVRLNSRSRSVKFAANGPRWISAPAPTS